MSNLVFPYYLQGKKLALSRVPIGGSTGITRAVSGVASAIAKQPWPRNRYKLSWEFLDDQKTRSNMIANSGDATQWTKTTGGVGTTPIVVANAAQAPDGTWTADQVLLSAALGSTGADFSDLITACATPMVVGGTYTYSLYLRTLDGSTMSLNVTGPANTAVTFTITPAWQRITITATATITGPALGPYVNGLGPKTANLAVWGAQSEPGIYASSYIPTGSSALNVSDFKVLDGIVRAMRGSYDTFLFLDPAFNTVQGQSFGTGNASSTAFQLQAQASTDGATLGPNGFPDIVQTTVGAPSVYVTRYGLPELASPTSRTNQAVQSQALATTWTQSGCTSTNNASIAPDGTTTATQILETTANSLHGVGETASCSSSSIDVTLSAFVRPNLTRTWTCLSMNEATGGTSAYAFFNLTGSGAIGTLFAGTNWSNVRATITPANNGFYRVTITATKLNAATSLGYFILSAPSDNVQTFVGVVTNGITGWGAQFEIGSLPTMYLPTTTVGATATDYSVSSTGLVTFTTAPPTAAALTWTGSFYFRARFTTDDPGDFSEILNRMWELKQLEFESEYV